MSTLMKTDTKHSIGMASGGSLSPGEEWSHVAVGQGSFSDEILFKLYVNG